MDELLDGSVHTELIKKLCNTKPVRIMRRIRWLRYNKRRDFIIERETQISSVVYPYTSTKSNDHHIL
jgi:hypothetical protein